MKVESQTCGDRSTCPINAMIEIVGDQWTLLILRDALLTLRTRFSEFEGADEGIATNILSTRLAKLVAHGVFEKHADPIDRRASIYIPTDRALDLIPVLLAAIAWSDRHQPGADKHPELMKAYRADPNGASAMVADRARTFIKETRP